MFENILLISVYILPIWYRYNYFFKFFENKKWFIFSRDNSNIFHLFSIIEIFLFIMSFGILIQKPFEIIIFNLVFYFWIISSIFVLWKILRKKNIFPVDKKHKNKLFFYNFIILFFLLLEIFFIYFLWFKSYIYFYLLWVLLLTPVISYVIIQLFFKKIMMKKAVILTGGPGLERDIAIKSAKFFEDNLWKQYDKYLLPDELEKFINNKDKYDLAIPVFHGEYGEDGQVFSLLNTLDIPHSFSDYKTHALCLDKEKTNILVFQLWIKIPFQYIAQHNQEFPEKYPVIMKPNNGGSSFHTYKINDSQEFYDCFEKTRKDLSDEILIQEFIVWDEYSVPVVDWEVLPIMKVEKQDNWELFDYNSKYVSEAKMKETFPEIDEDLKNILEQNTLKIYSYFWIKWMCRIDYLIKDNQAYFLEINTIPGMTAGSILPKSWEKTGRNFKELVEKVTKI